MLRTKGETLLGLFRLLLLASPTQLGLWVVRLLCVLVVLLREHFGAKTMIYDKGPYMGENDLKDQLGSV